MPGIPGRETMTSNEVTYDEWRISYVADQADFFENGSKQKTAMMTDQAMRTATHGQCLPRLYSSPHTEGH